MKIIAVIMVSVFIAVAGMPFAATADLSHIAVVPVGYRHIMVEAYLSLPSRLREALRGGQIEVIFKDGDVLGGAAASDQFGLDLAVHSVYVRWPEGTNTMSFPWGEMSILHATRHELAHIALERVFQGNSQLWVGLIEALREEGPEFLEKVAVGHKDAADLYSRSSIASYGSLHEYLASLAEHCGKPVRMPLPTGRARSMVKALMAGSTCN